MRAGSSSILILPGDIPDPRHASSSRYTEALQQHGVDARLTLEPGLGHNILVTPAAFRKLGGLVCELEAKAG